MILRKEITITKTLKLPKDSIYLVISAVEYEGYDVLAAFKTKQLAEKFVDECMRLLKDGKTEL